MTFWEEKFFVSIDTETTGINPQIDRICEIGFSIWYKGEQVNHWGTLLNPCMPINIEASEVHGIYDNDVSNQPMFVDVVDKIMFLLSMGVHVMYNAPFDIGMISAELQRCGIKYPSIPVIDPMVWFTKFEKYNKGKNLVAAAKRYGFSHIGAHRAFEDAFMSMKILYHMYKTKPSIPKDLKVLLKKQRQLAESHFNELNNYRRKRGLDLWDPPKFELYELGM